MPIFRNLIQSRSAAIFFVSTLCLNILLYEPALAEEDKKEIQRFKVFLHSGKVIEGKNGLLTSASFTGIDADGEEIRIPLSDIRSLKRRTSKGSASGAAAGAGLGALGAGLVIVKSGFLTTDATIALVPLLLAVGIGAGLLIGTAAGHYSDSWEKVELGMESSINIHLQETRIVLEYKF